MSTSFSFFGQIFVSLVQNTENAVKASWNVLMVIASTETYA